MKTIALGVLIVGTLAQVATGALLGYMLHVFVGFFSRDVQRAVPAWVWIVAFAGLGVISVVRKAVRGTRRHAVHQALLRTLAADRVAVVDDDLVGWNRHHHVAKQFALARADLRLVIVDVRQHDATAGKWRTVVQITRPGLALPPLHVVPTGRVGRALANLFRTSLEVAPTPEFARRFLVYGEETARPLLTGPVVDLLLAAPDVELTCRGDTFAVVGPAWRNEVTDDMSLVHFALQVLQAFAAARGTAPSPTGPA